MLLEASADVTSEETDYEVIQVGKRVRGGRLLDHCGPDYLDALEVQQRMTGTVPDGVNELRRAIYCCGGEDLEACEITIQFKKRTRVSGVQVSFARESGCQWRIKNLEDDECLFDGN